MHTLVENNTSPLHNLCTLMTQRIPLSTLTLIRMKGPPPNIYNLFFKAFTWSKFIPTIVGPRLGKVHWHCSTGEPQPCEVAMCVVPWCICLLPTLKNVQ